MGIQTGAEDRSHAVELHARYPVFRLFYMPRAIVYVISQTMCLLADPSDPFEEVDISELLHLLNVYDLHNLLVVEQDPRCLLTQLLPDERNIVPAKVRG